MWRGPACCKVSSLVGLQVAFLKGDYRATSYDAWSVMGPVLLALRSAAVTWVRPRPQCFAHWVQACMPLQARQASPK